MMDAKEFKQIWAAVGNGTAEPGWERSVEDGGYTLRLRNPLLKVWAIMDWQDNVEYHKNNA